MLNSGINYLVYNGTIQESIIAKYEKLLRSKTKDADSETEIKVDKADDGLYYIKAGKYKIQLKNNTGTADNEWVLE